MTHAIEGELLPEGLNVPVDQIIDTMLQRNTGICSASSFGQTSTPMHCERVVGHPGLHEKYDRLNGGKWSWR